MKFPQKTHPTRLFGTWEYCGADKRSVLCGEHRQQVPPSCWFSTAGQYPESWRQHITSFLVDCLDEFEMNILTQTVKIMVQSAGWHFIESFLSRFLNNIILHIQCEISTFYYPCHFTSLLHGFWITSLLFKGFLNWSDYYSPTQLFNGCKNRELKGQQSLQFQVSHPWHSTSLME